VPGLVLILFFLIGCVQPSFQVQGPAQGVALKAPLASEVLMEVDDAGVKWGSGKVGDVLKTALVKNRTFGQVYYPIYPTRAIPNKLQIVARGDMEAESGAMGKAVVTGLLLFLPVGVLQYRETYSVTADVFVIRDSRKYGPLVVESKVSADHTLFEGPETYAAQVQRMALDDLAGRIASAVAEHPEWFGE